MFIIIIFRFVSHTAPEGLEPPTVSVTTTSDDITFQWMLPAKPNGVIVNYSLYINDKLLYTGLSLTYQ